MPGIVATVAQVLQFRVEQIGGFASGRPDAGARRLFSLKEPKTGTDGTLSWTVDVFNPATGEDFVLGLKEITLPGRRYPPLLGLAVRQLPACPRRPDQAARSTCAWSIRLDRR